MKARVLLIEGDGTQTLPVAKSLVRKGHEVIIFYRNKLSYGFATRYANIRIKSPAVKDEANYKRFLKKHIVECGIDVIIPMGDATAEFLSKHKEDFSSISNYIIPDYNVFQKGYDKNMLMSVCKKFGFPHPDTVDMNSVSISNIDDSFFPGMLKPNYTTGGRGMSKVMNRAELENIYERTRSVYGDCHFQKFIQPGGRQFKVELFIDHEYRLINHSVIHKIRYYPISAGSSSCNTTIVNKNLVDICYSVLKKIGWIGFADFDLIEDPLDGEIKIMEINPRIPACIKSVFESGIDYATLIVHSSLKIPVKPFKYQPGHKLRHIGFEFLWFIKSKSRFSTKPGWFRFFDKDLSFQDFSIDDPMPFILGTLGSIRKMVTKK